MCTFSLLTGVAAKADLGDADVRIDSPSNTRNLSRSFKAKCGKQQRRCTAKFKDGKLIINDGKGIYREQLVRVDTSRTCRQKSIVLPFVTTCYGEQLDYDYVVHYKDKEERQRSALISFWPGYLRREISHKKGFAAALDSWRSDMTPYMSQELENRKREMLLSTCSEKFIKYECSWSNYLQQNPQVADWAKNNPELANVEFQRLNLLPW